MVIERAHQALAQSAAVAAAGATAAPSPSTRPQGVASQRPRPVDNAIFKDSSVIAIVASTAKAKLGYSVKREWIKLPHNAVATIDVLPFPTSLTARSNLHARLDLQCLTFSCAATAVAQSVRSLTWATGWDHPFHMAFTRAITPDTPTTPRMMTLIDYCFGQVSRDMAGGASGPETFTPLLRLLMTHFDRVDSGEGYTKCLEC